MQFSALHLLLLLPAALGGDPWHSVRSPTSTFSLNTLNTTGYGAAWADNIVSSKVDFISCRGDYASCLYSKCSPTVSAPWAPGVPLANCPCEKQHGLFLVMINGILDEHQWRATRQRCPLGLLSCPLPDTAPICSRITNNTLFQGAPGLSNASLTSAYFFDNITATSNNCSPGPYAGCMTAPCAESSDGAVSCQCPVANGPFQVSGQSCGSGIRSALHMVPAASPHEETWALVPENCDAVEPICYQGSHQALQSVLQEDTINCPGRHQSKLIKETCLQGGYGLHLGKDPIFRETDIYAVRPPVPSADFLERCENRSAHYQAPPGTTVLIIATSHGVLGDANCTSCKPTGVESTEFTAPYYVFKDAGVNVTLASVEGGEIPVDAQLRDATHWDVRFWSTPADRQLTVESPSVKELDFASFDMVYMAGGWGAAWDMGTSPAIAQGITDAAAAGRVLGSVCHGALGFIGATTPEGKPFVQGRNMTAVTNRQIKQLGIINLTPLHPEVELRRLGAHFFASHGVLTDIDQSLVVVDGSLVTGQNQNSACETAQRMLDQL